MVRLIVAREETNDSPAIDSAVQLVYTFWHSAEGVAALSSV
jgi:hypothetical protein